MGSSMTASALALIVLAAAGTFGAMPGVRPTPSSQAPSTSTAEPQGCYDPSTRVTPNLYVVSLTPSAGDLATVAQAMAQAYGIVVGATIFDGFSAVIPGDRVDAVRADSRVVGLSVVYEVPRPGLRPCTPTPTARTSSSRGMQGGGDLSQATLAPLPNSYVVFLSRAAAPAVRLQIIDQLAQRHRITVDTVTDDQTAFTTSTLDPERLEGLCVEPNVRSVTQHYYLSPWSPDEYIVFIDDAVTTSATRDSIEQIAQQYGVPIEGIAGDQCAFGTIIASPDRLSMLRADQRIVGLIRNDAFPVGALVVVPPPPFLPCR